MPGTSKLVLLAAILLSGNAPVLAQEGSARGGNPTVCPASGRATVTPVFRALTLEMMADFREEHGLSAVNARNLKPLRTYQASDVCQKLNAYYATSMFGRAPWQRTYFEADGFYFASFVDNSNPKTGRRRPGHFAVFDASLRLLGVFPGPAAPRR